MRRKEAFMYSIQMLLLLFDINRVIQWID